MQTAIKLIMISAALLASMAFAMPRDASQKAAFRKEHPCPSTHKVRGACPNYQVDHIVPLCAGGADHPSNMQWLSVQQHKAKTKGEHARRVCRVSRHKS